MCHSDSRRMVLLTLAVLVTGCSSPSLEAPTSFETWGAEDGSFQLEYPTGWEASGGAKQGIQWARFSYEGASIYVTASTADSLLGDISDIGNDLISGGLRGRVGNRMSSAAQAHDVNKDRVVSSENYLQFQESKGEGYRSPLGKAWRTQFTAMLGDGRKVCGYRATILAGDTGITVFTHCNASDWKTMQPAFQRVLEEMKQGKPPG